MKLFLLLAAVLVSQATAQRKVVCYVASWAVYRQGDGQFQFEDIDPNLCTHANYAFVGINNDGSIRVDDGTDGFSRLNALKQGSQMKTLVSIGGWTEGSAGFSKVVNDDGLRGAFVNNAVNFLGQYEFDGLDIDWEYPAQREGSQSSDKAAYIQLLRDLRAQFDQHGYLLTAAVGTDFGILDASYDVAAISENLDFINLMTYDFHGSWDTATGENAPLYARAADANQNANVDAAVKNWINHGASPEKIVLGIGLYGHSFTLADAGNNGIGAPVTGPGTAGPWSGEAGTLAYTEICQSQANGGWNVNYDDESQVPYASKGDQWVGYDNTQSIQAKAQYIVDNGLGGAMVWSIDMDDFRGLCGDKYPLMNAINNGVR